MDHLLTPSYRQLTPLKDQLKELLEKLDLSTAMKNSPSRSKRLKLLKKTIMEVRSEMSLKKSLPPPPPPIPLDTVPTPTQSEEDPPQEAPAYPLPPPTLELLTSPFQPETSPSNSEPPSLKPVAPLSEETPVELAENTNTSTSVPVNGYISDQLLINGDIHVEASRTCNRRTNILFRKSKSASPQKPPKGQEVSAVAPPPLGAKTFLSVVIPRLETLLLPKKRTRCSSADSEEDGQTPIKRIGTGAHFKKTSRKKHYPVIMNLPSFTCTVSDKCAVFCCLVRSNKWFCDGGEDGFSVTSAAGTTSPMCLRVQHFLQRQHLLWHRVTEPSCFFKLTP